MKTYEAMFLIDSRPLEKNEKQGEELVKTIMEKAGAKIHLLGRWDERKLAYPIEKAKRATYLLAYLDATAEAVTHIRRECGLSEIILRALVLRHTGEIPQEIRVKKEATTRSEHVAREERPAEEMVEVGGGADFVDWEEQE